MEREYGFDLRPAPAVSFMVVAWKTDYFAVQLAQNGNASLASRVSSVLHSRLDYTMLSDRSGWLG